MRNRKLNVRIYVSKHFTSCQCRFEASLGHISDKPSSACEWLGVFLADRPPPSRPPPPPGQGSKWVKKCWRAVTPLPENKKKKKVYWSIMPYLARFLDRFKSRNYFAVLERQLGIRVVNVLLQKIESKGGWSYSNFSILVCTLVKCKKENLFLFSKITNRLLSQRTIFLGLAPWNGMLFSTYWLLDRKDVFFSFQTKRMYMANLQKCLSAHLGSCVLYVRN